MNTSKDRMAGLGPDDSEPSTQELLERVREALKYRYHSGTLHYNEAEAALATLSERLQVAERERDEALAQEKLWADDAETAVDRAEAAEQRVAELEANEKDWSDQARRYCERLVETLEALNLIANGVYLGSEAEEEVLRCKRIAHKALSRN